MAVQINLFLFVYFFIWRLWSIFVKKKKLNRTYNNILCIHPVCAYTDKSSGRNFIRTNNYYIIAQCFKISDGVLHIITLYGTMTPLGRSFSLGFSFFLSLCIRIFALRYSHYYNILLLL